MAKNFLLHTDGEGVSNNSFSFEGVWNAFIMYTNRSSWTVTHIMDLAQQTDVESLESIAAVDDRAIIDFAAASSLPLLARFEYNGNPQTPMSPYDEDDVKRGSALGSLTSPIQTRPAAFSIDSVASLPDDQRPPRSVSFTNSNEVIPIKRTVCLFFFSFHDVQDEHQNTKSTCSAASFYAATFDISFMGSFMNP